MKPKLVFSGDNIMHCSSNTRIGRVFCEKFDNSLGREIWLVSVMGIESDADQKQWMIRNYVRFCRTEKEAHEFVENKLARIPIKHFWLAGDETPQTTALVLDETAQKWFQMKDLDIEEEDRESWMMDGELMDAWSKKRFNHSWVNKFVSTDIFTDKNTVFGPDQEQLEDALKKGAVEYENWGDEAGAPILVATLNEGILNLPEYRDIANKPGSSLEELHAAKDWLRPPELSDCFRQFVLAGRNEHNSELLTEFPRWTIHLKTVARWMRPVSLDYVRWNYESTGSL